MLDFGSLLNNVLGLYNYYILERVIAFPLFIWQRSLED